MPSPASGERQPLLGASKDSLRYPDGVEGLGESSEPALSSAHKLDDDDEEVQAISSPWKVFYAFLFVLGIVGTVLCFIDPGDVDFDWNKALKYALGGGISGAVTMVLQVLTLMPLRTVTNYQYRYGSTTTHAIRILYADGGWTRYYQGLSAALIQGPVSRFGDTAANDGILALLASNPFMRKLPSLVKTIFASLAAAAFRILLTPIDTVKTTLQTQGRDGMRILKDRIGKYGFATLWYGAVANAAATFVGHYPWFGTYNYLDDNLPFSQDTWLQKLIRRAFIGFVASVVSDTTSNSLRVLKTYRQVNKTKIGYMDAARAVIAVDGWKGLFGRGLKTRILTNSFQGLMFAVLWKIFIDWYVIICAVWRSTGGVRVFWCP